MRGSEVGFEYIRARSDREEAENAPNSDENKVSATEASEEGNGLVVGAFVITLILFVTTLTVRYFYFRRQ